jgi:crotonobetainyl-CoA:carnitine CoA-transferase CaiB-like acyl-CoA transferase
VDDQVSVERRGPLDGIRVIDFTRFQQGPWGTVMLADMGAEVVKVEEPGSGDLGRALGMQPDAFCAYFEAHDRNKKSITINLKSSDGIAVVERLLSTADVLVHNFRPGVMERLGLGYDHVRSLNRRIIYAAATGFGPDGPRAQHPSFDSIGQGMSGIMVTQAGGPGRDPEMTMPGVADQVGGMALAYGVAMALIARERFGVVDTSLYGSQISLQAYYITGNLRDGVHKPRRVNPTFTAYGCGDGKWLTVAILDLSLFAGLCAAVGRPELASDTRFAEPFARAQHADELSRLLRDAFLAGPRQLWLERLQANRVPCGPVQDHIEVGNEAAVEPQLRSEDVPVNHYRLIGEVRDAAPRDAIIAADGEITMGVARAILPGFTPRRTLNAGTTGCMGTGLPYAIGAKLAHPEAPVIAVLGDYAFGAAAIEVETAARVGANLVIVVANNGGIAGHGIQDRMFPADAPPIAALIPAQYEKMVEMVGGNARCIDHPSQIRPAIEDALKADRLSLINVMTDPKGSRRGAMYLG